MIVEFHDVTFFEEVFPMNTNIPQGKFDDDLTGTSSFIHDHGNIMINEGADWVSNSTLNQVEEPRRNKCTKIVKDTIVFNGTWELVDIPCECFTI